MAGQAVTKLQRAQDMHTTLKDAAEAEVSKQAVCAIMAIAIAALTMATGAHAAAPIYAKPIVITKGGTYTGAWASTDVNTSAVWVNTREPVIIENSYLKGPGRLITSQPSANVTVRNSFAYGSVAPGNPAFKFFIDAFSPASLTIEHCYVTGIPLVRVLGFRKLPTGTVVIRYNRGRDVQGNLVHFNDARGMPGADVGWNEAVNRPGSKTVMEDVFSVYGSSGVAGKPIDIHDNFVFGTYASLSPTTEVSTGTAYNGGDQAPGSGRRSAFVRIHDNQVARTGSAGPGAPGGHDIEIDHNRAISSGRLPTGEYVNNDYSYGASVWDYYENGRAFRNNRAHDNVSGFVSSTGGIDPKPQRHDFFLPDCAKDARGVSLCTGNVALPGPITTAMEFAEYGRWQAKLAAAGISLGPDIAPDPAYPGLYEPTF